MTKWLKPSDEMIATFYRLTGSDARIEQRKMFGCPVAFMNGNMFFAVHQTDLVARLPEGQRTKLFDDGDGRPFQPMPGMTMKEYVCLDERVADDAGRLRQLFKDAVAYVATLPAKVKKKKKKKTTTKATAPTKTTVVKKKVVNTATANKKATNKKAAKKTTAKKTTAKKKAVKKR